MGLQLQKTIIWWVFALNGVAEFGVTNIVSLLKLNRLNMNNTYNKPMCQCGNSSDHNGYCDGSHANINKF